MTIEEFKTAGYHDLTYPHREILLSYITKYQPESVLDVGCGSSADLWLIKQAFPNCKLTGIDKTPSPLDGATILNERLQDELPKLQESYDVIFTNGVLMYLSHEDKAAALDEMLKRANKAIILSEINPYEPSNTAFDYGAYFTSKGLRVDAHKIPPHIRADTQWSHNGYIYEVVLNN